MHQEILNIFRQVGYIPLAVPHLYQSAIIEACAVDESTLFKVENSAKRITTDTYLLNHPFLPIAAMLANATIKSPKFPIQLMHSSRFHIPSSVDGGRPTRLTQEPLCIGFSHMIPKGEDTNSFLLMRLQRAMNSIPNWGLNMEIFVVSPKHYSNDERIRYSIQVQSGGSWIEIARASGTGGFLSRRMNLRYKDEATGKTEFPLITHGFVNVTHMSMLLA